MSTTWNTIGSAPKTGERILLGGCSYGPSIRIGWWGSGRYDRSSKTFEKDWVSGSDYGLEPTHWMPLPDEPSSD